MGIARILLAVYSDGHFTEQLRVVHLLRQAGGYEPIVYFAEAYAQCDRDIETCRSAHVACVDGCPGRGDGARSAPGTSGVAGPASWIVRIVKGALWRLPFPFTLLRALLRQWQHLRVARRTIAAHQPDLLVLSEDSVGHETAALIASGRRQGIASVIVPFTVANALEPAEAYYRDPRFAIGSLSSRLAARLYPRWVYEHRGRRLLRLPAPQLIAKEWWGLAPPLPWIVNSGFAAALAVESAFMEQYYLREGLPAGQMVRTGALSDDVLAAHRRDAPERRAELCRELGLQQGRPLLLCAMPPDQFILSGPQTEFADYASMLQFWVQALAAVPGWNVVVRLHPRMGDDACREVERLGARVSRRDTASLVPLCDLYVASVSATIRWAIACGKPVLNYDAYRLRWTDYDDAPGVVRVEDRADFTATLQRLAADATYYERVKASQEADAERWGRLDGQAGARLLRLFDKLSSREAA